MTHSGFLSETLAHSASTQRLQNHSLPEFITKLSNCPQLSHFTSLPSTANICSIILVSPQIPVHQRSLLTPHRKGAREAWKL